MTPDHVIALLMLIADLRLQIEDQQKTINELRHATTSTSDEC